MPDIPGGLADRLLAYADRPWRVVAVIVLGLAAVGGYTLWEQRATIAAKILENTVVPRLEPQRFPAIAQELLELTHADLVVLARVDLAANLHLNIDGRLAGEPAWRPRPEPRAIFRDQLTSEQIAALIEGRAICQDVPAKDGRRIDVELGMTRRCIVAVPPIPDVFVGALGIAWRDKAKLSPAIEAAAMSDLRRLAMRLATW